MASGPASTQRGPRRSPTILTRSSRSVKCCPRWWTSCAKGRHKSRPGWTETTQLISYLACPRRNSRPGPASAAPSANTVGTSIGSPQLGHNVAIGPQRRRSVGRLPGAASVLWEAGHPTRHLAACKALSAGKAPPRFAPVRESSEAVRLSHDRRPIAANLQQLQSFAWLGP